MSVYAGSGRLAALSVSPPTPPVGYCLIYFKDDNILYIKDASGAETAIGTAAGITALTGDVTATGPGSAAAIVAQVGGKTAAEIADAVNELADKTSTNTPSTIVFRDASGNFSAGIITASLVGTASGNVAKTGDTMSGDLNMGGNQIRNMAGPLLSGDATNKSYVDTNLDLKFDKVGGTITGGVAINSSSGTALVVDGNVFVVDAANNRIGINKLNPVEALDVVGNAAISGTISASNFSGSVSGTNTGDVTVVDSASIDLFLTGQQLTAVLIDTPVTPATYGSATAVSQVTVDQKGRITGASSVSINIPSSQVSNFTEAAQDAVGGSFVDTETIDLVYDDSLNQISSNVRISDATLTSDVNGLKVGVIENANVGTGIDATKIGGGLVSNTEFGYLDGVTSSIQTQLNSITGSAVTSLTGDVTGTGPGATATTVAQVGGKTAAQVSTSVDDTLAATNLNTASTIVKRDASGDFSAGTITANLTGNVNGVDPAAHASRHLPSGADALTTAAPLANLSATTTNDVGTANSLARSDHSHAISTGTVSTITPDQTNAAGTSANLARADHIHNIPSGTPVQIGTANFDGAAASFALSDHVHAHGNQTSPTLHAAATTSANGFMSSADKTKLDASTALNTPSAIVQRDTSGNFSAGIITADLSGTATNFSGSLVGDVTGTQGSTVVSQVGGKTAAEVSTSVDDTLAATDLNTPSTLVKRDASGNFSAARVDQSTVRVRGTTNSVDLTADPSVNYALTLPPTQGVAGTYLTNNGSGVLSWSSPLVNIDGGKPDTVFVIGATITGGTP